MHLDSRSTIPAPHPTVNADRDLRQLTGVLEALTVRHETRGDTMVKTATVVLTLMAALTCLARGAARGRSGKGRGSTIGLGEGQLRSVGLARNEAKEGEELPLPG